jgi:DNA repair protein SbcD/Mre11
MKTPIALLVTDTHLKESNIELVTNIWRQSIDECRKLGIDQIFFLGDFFDSRKGQPLTVLKAGQRIVEILRDSGIKTIAISGNHSKMDYDSPDSYIDIYNSEHFQVISGYAQKKYGDLFIHFLPYFKESGSYPERLRGIVPRTGTKNILLTHIAINGSITNDNEHISNCIPSSEFSKFDWVGVGHFHNRNEFENITYIGSPYQKNYGEDDNKGFTILYSDGSYEFTKTNFPKYIKKRVSLDNLEDLMLNSDFLHNSEGNNARVELTGDSELLKSFDKSILEDLGIEVVLKPSESIISLDETETTTYDKKSLKEAFISFCDENKVEATEYALNKIEKI